MAAREEEFEFKDRRYIDNKGFDDDDEDLQPPIADETMSPLLKTSTHRNIIFEHSPDQDKDLTKSKPSFFITDKMKLREKMFQINRDEVKFFFPRMSDSIEVKNEGGGVLLIKLFGDKEWIKLKIKDKTRERFFRKELKDALGPTVEEIRNELREEVKFFFPEISGSVEVNPFSDKLEVRLSGEEKWSNLKTKSGEINKRISRKLKNALGPARKEIINKNQGEIDFNQGEIDLNQGEIDFNKERVSKLEEEINSDDIILERKEELIKEKNELNETINELNEKNDVIEETNNELEEINSQLEDKLPLRDRIRLIFKKHGFTVISIISAVGVVVGVIISNLSAGLAKMARGVGNGLKDIGKKLGALLPGMIGAIASFIFKTAGEVVGFLAKNAWLLIIVVVVAVVDQFKSGALTKSFKKKKK